jgi:hypothetical protein
VTEFHITQRVRFKPLYRGYGNALLPISEEIGPRLAEAVLSGEPMQVTVKGYEQDEEEDIDVVIVSVQHGKSRYEQWVHPNCIEPLSKPERSEGVEAV